MLGSLRDLDFGSKLDLVPVVLMLIAMPVSGSIGHAIGIAMITYVLIRLFTGRAKEVSILSWVIAAVFLVKFLIPMG